ncbi:MAG: universal stress protein [Pseudonocardiaceae bacterium]
MDEQRTPDAPEVVVGTDGTDTSLRAVAWAAAEARLRDVPLRIVHAAPYVTPTNKVGRRRATAILGRAYTVAHQYEPQLLAHTEQLDQQPVHALVEASKDAALLAVGMVGDRLGEVVIGSVALSVSASAHCPVAVVRGHHRSPSEGDSVLLGLENVAVDSPAITVAFDDAQRHGTPLIILHAQRDSVRSRVTGRNARTAPEQALAEQLAPWRSRYPTVPTELRMVHGAPAEELLRAASTARLVVVGTHGHRGPARAVLGSTSRMLVRHSSCPVIVAGRDTVAGKATPAPSAALPHRGD